MAIRIKIITEVLTDKSKVYNVVMIDEDAGGVVYLPCVDSKAADRLVENLITSIDQFTVVACDHEF